MRMLINVDVPELDKAVEFYCSAFDLQHDRTLDNDVAELSGGQFLIYLLQQREGSLPASASGELRHYTRHWTPVHIDFVVKDIEQAAQRAIDAGAKRESECVSWRHSNCITLSDPFGNGFCLIEFEGDAYRSNPIVPI